MMIRFLSLIFFALSVFSCSNRSPFEAPQSTQTNDGNDLGYLRLVGPDFFGSVKETNDGFFKEATFVDFEASDIWAVYSKQDGEWQRLTLDLDFEQPLDFIMFTDKYHDNQGRGHLAVYSGVRFVVDNPVVDIRLAIVDPQSENEFDQYFQIIQPTQFGEVIHNANGEFIEAYFDGLSANDVWAIIRTNSNDVRRKINFARKLNKPIYYYLKNDSTGIRVGLPWESAFPDRNIEVVIER